MATGYKKVFWGYILTTIHLTVETFTLFPAFIGYMIILGGYYDIEGSTTKKVDSRVPRITTALLVLLTIIVPFMSFFLSINIDALLLFNYYPSILMVLEFMLMHKLFEIGINELAFLQVEKTAEVFERKDKSYLILMGLAIVVVTIGLTANNGYFELATLTGIGLSLLAKIYLLFTLHALKNSFLEQE